MAPPQNAARPGSRGARRRRAAPRAPRALEGAPSSVEASDLQRFAPWAFGLALTLPLTTALRILPPGWFGPAATQHRPEHVAAAVMLGAIWAALLAWCARHRRAWLDPQHDPRVAAAVWVLLPALAVYLANGDASFEGDCYYNGILPRRLARGEGFAFSDEYVRTHASWGLHRVAPDRHLPYWPVGPAVLALPTALLQELLGAPAELLSDAVNQKLTAALTGATAAAALFTAQIRLRRSVFVAVLGTVGFAFGTTQLTHSAAQLWQHGPATMLACLGVAALAGVGDEPEGRPRWRRAEVLAGVALGLAPVMRPQAALLTMAAFAAVLFARPRAALDFALGCVPGALLFATLNLSLYGSLLGGYQTLVSGSHFHASLRDGLAGLLLSPNRGLLVFSPFLVAALPGAWIAARRRASIELCLGAAAVAFTVLHAKWVMWFGGWCVGPRFMTEALPPLVLLSGLAMDRWSGRWARASAGALVLASVLINAMVFASLPWVFRWNAFPDVDNHRERLWDRREWIPLHGAHARGLARGDAVPAWPFAIPNHPRLSPAAGHPRAVVAQGVASRSQPVLELPEVPLRAGDYTLTVRGTNPGDLALTLGVRASLLVQGEAQDGGGDTVQAGPRAPWSAALRFSLAEGARVSATVLLRGAGVVQLTDLRLTAVGP